MLVKQLSIFLENRRGRFTEVCNILGEAGVNMTAFTVAESSDFGMLRLIVSDPEKAMAILREHKYAVSLTEVICLRCPNVPGSLARAMNILTDSGVFIEYMYAFSAGETANVVIRPDNLEQSVKVLKDNNLALLAASDLYKI